MISLKECSQKRLGQIYAHDNGSAGRAVWHIRGWKSHKNGIHKYFYPMLVDLNRRNMCSDVRSWIRTSNQNKHPGFQITVSSGNLKADVIIPHRAMFKLDGKKFLLSRLRICWLFTVPTRVIFEGLKLTVGMETIFTIVELKKPSIEIEREVFVVVALFLHLKKGDIWREQNKKRYFFHTLLQSSTWKEDF